MHNKPDCRNSNLSNQRHAELGRFLEANFYHKTSQRTNLITNIYCIFPMILLKFLRKALQEKALKFQFSQIWYKQKNIYDFLIKKMLEENWYPLLGTTNIWLRFVLHPFWNTLMLLVISKWLEKILNGMPISSMFICMFPHDSIIFLFPWHLYFLNNYCSISSQNKRSHPDSRLQQI